MTDKTTHPVIELNSAADSIVDVGTVEKLSSGFLVLYKPELERVKKQLVEFTKKQEGLLHQLESENKNFQEVMETTELHEVMATVKACHGKLSNIKKEMGLIHERTNRLKKRAMRLQQAKQREAFTRTLQREERLLHEQSLIATPAHRSETVSMPVGEATNEASTAQIDPSTTSADL